MKRWKMRQLVLGLVLAIGWMGVADADPRIALVIGNGAYPESPLSNALNDSKGMKTALVKLGFQVIYLENADLLQMNRATDEFIGRLETDSEGLFYFSGHGSQAEGSNYLVPLQAEIRDEVELQHRAFDVGLVLDKMRKRGNRLNLVILDACRDNPFKGFKAVIGGLAGMSGPEGTLIAFASAPNTPALNNRSGNNSLFTKHLLLHIAEPGLKIEDLLKKVRLGVKSDSPNPNRPQTPWENGSLLGDFCFAGCADRAESQAEVELRVAKERIRQLEHERRDQATQPSIGGERGNDQIAVEEVGRNKPTPAGVSGKLSGQMPETVVARPYSGLQPKTESVYGIEMVKIPGGTFQMGCGPKDGECETDEKPRHRVTVPAFAMAKTEITQGQWKAVMGSAPPELHNKTCGDDCPVESVSWNEVQAFIKTLNQQTGGHYRLPSEAEWEYACRAGQDTLYCGGDDVDAVAWYYGNSGFKTHQVAGKKPNDFGLYDMSGNVWEWVQDCYHDRYQGAPGDGSAWDGGANCASGWRVLRGGAFHYDHEFVRCASRYDPDPDYRGSSSGFRVVVSPW